MAEVLCVFAHPDDESLCCGGTIAKHVAAGDTVRCVQRGNNVNITVGTAYRVEEVAGGDRPDDLLRYHIENNVGLLRWYRAECFERVAGDTVHDEIQSPPGRASLEEIVRVREQVARQSAGVAVERRVVTTGEYAGVEQQLLQQLRQMTGS